MDKLSQEEFSQKTFPKGYLVLQDSSPEFLRLCEEIKQEFDKFVTSHIAVVSVESLVPEWIAITPEAITEFGKALDIGMLEHFSSPRSNFCTKHDGPCDPVNLSMHRIMMACKHCGKDMPND